MRTLIVLLALAGALVSALALRASSTSEEDFFTVTDDWNCGVVDRSPYARIGPLPIAGIGIAGYLFMVVLTALNGRGKLAVVASVGLAFSLYLSHVEEYVLRVWCQYCAISQVLILALAILSVIWWWSARQSTLGEAAP